MLFSPTRWVCASLIGACALFGLPAIAAPVFVFGDSLSDGGNAALSGHYDPTQVVSGNSYVPTATYAPDGVFSNGPVWTTRFAQGTGSTLAPSLSGGTNYAFGGARVGDSEPTSLVGQTSMFLDDLSDPADPSALYVVAGGGNDLRAAIDQYGLAYMQAASSGAANPHEIAIAQVLPAAIAAYAAGMNQILDTLAGVGATNLVVWNVPYAAGAPAIEAAGASALADGFAQAMNDALVNMVLSTRPDVRLFDMYGLARSYVENGAELGFTNVDDACGAVAGADCSTYLWWDGIHPTTAAHQRIAQAMLQAIGPDQALPEPATVMLMLVGVLWFGAAARRTQHGRS